MCRLELWCSFHLPFQYLKKKQQGPVIKLMSQQAVRQPRRLCVGLVKRPGREIAIARVRGMKVGKWVCRFVRMTHALRRAGRKKPIERRSRICDWKGYTHSPSGFFIYTHHIAWVNTWVIPWLFPCRSAVYVAKSTVSFSPSPLPFLPLPIPRSKAMATLLIL